MKLKDKVAIVTGSGRGIGREMALILAEEGADLVLSARTQVEIETVAQLIRGLGRKALPLVADVTSEEQVNRMVQRAVQEFGKIDILVNNAGGALNSFYTLIIDLSLENWRSVLETNVTGTFLCSKAVLPYMIKQRSGVIINVSSSMGKKARTGAGAYSTAKFAVEGLTQTLHYEASPFNIRVNVLSPGGLVATPGMLKYHHDTPLDKMLQPGVVRELLLFLASDDSTGISGQSLTATTWSSEQRETKAHFARSANLKSIL